MDNETAHKIIRDLRDVALRDVEEITARLDREFDENTKDPSIDTVAIISRLQDRLERRAHEAEALAIAASKF